MSLLGCLYPLQQLLRPPPQQHLQEHCNFAQNLQQRDYGQLAGQGYVLAARVKQTQRRATWEQCRVSVTGTTLKPMLASMSTLTLMWTPQLFAWLQE